MAEVIRLTLEGPDAAPGRIPASDVARLLQGYERALGRAAEARTRRQARTGRRGSVVESTTKLVFRSITMGSLVAELELPDLQTSGDLGFDEAHLGRSAADDVFALCDDPDSPADERLVDALEQLTAEIGIGDRYTSLTVATSTGTHRSSTITGATRQRLVERIKRRAPRARDDMVIGVLFEADFEKFTAQVRTSDQQRVDVRFSPDQAGDVQEALRLPQQLQGRITYDPRTNAMRSIQLERIVRPEQQVLSNPDEFWMHRSVAELAVEQGVSAVVDLSALVAHDATDEELAAFLDAVES